MLIYAHAGGVDQHRFAGASDLAGQTSPPHGGTATVAIGKVAAIPGTVVNPAASSGSRTSVRFGHPPRTLSAGY
ncbi:2-methylaconitate cis-trans isomerase PrpF family protein [Janthinobacterium psychrotolerans]|uniref:2-methylaconitate cis-trans isomerase PrpF family protein n=1 Tax=Janthinobacterium psychrotolerans TaxID=1747903 RepID=UPI001C255DBC